MVSDIEPRAEIGTPFPALFVNVKVTVGLLPAVPLVMLTMVALSPESREESVGTTCAPTMEASKSLAPCGTWHVEHRVSFGCAPPG
jgi:hypothetical protein